MVSCNEYVLTAAAAQIQIDHSTKSVIFQVICVCF